MTTRTAAKRYARALFDVVLKEHGDLSEVEVQLAAFCGLFDQYPSLAKVLLNPAVPSPRKRSATVELTRQAGTSPVLTKLLILLAERDRLILLPDLLTAYRERLADHQQIVRADVTTAAALSADRVQQIQASLSRATGRAVTLTTRIDPTLIGGLIARVGGTVYDASLTTQLAKMRLRLGENL